MARAKAKPKFTSHEDTLESAVGGAFSEIEELAGEFREMVDNAPENLHGSSLYETRESTADTLENLSAPDVPDALGEIGVTYTQAAGRGKRGAMSRATRAGLVKSGPLRSCAVIGVSTNPGLTTTTAMPRAARRCRSPWAYSASPPLADP